MKKYLPHLYRCSNCGGALTEDQIEMALADALLGTSKADQDQLTLCCPDYTPGEGCQGTDPQEVPYWYTR